MNYLIPDKVYDVLKWVSVILLPCVAWVYGELAPDYGIDPYRVVHALDVIGFAIGVFIGASQWSAPIRSNASDDNKLGE